jgi:hypothetical protein
VFATQVSTSRKAPDANHISEKFGLGLHGRLALESDMGRGQAGRLPSSIHDQPDLLGNVSQGRWIGHSSRNPCSRLSKVCSCLESIRDLLILARRPVQVRKAAKAIPDNARTCGKCVRAMLDFAVESGGQETPPPSDPRAGDRTIGDRRHRRAPTTIFVPAEPTPIRVRSNSFLPSRGGPEEVNSVYRAARSPTLVDTCLHHDSDSRVARTHRPGASRWEAPGLEPNENPAGLLRRVGRLNSYETASVIGPPPFTPNSCGTRVAAPSAAPPRSSPCRRRRST